MGQIFDALGIEQRLAAVKVEDQAFLFLAVKRARR